MKPLTRQSNKGRPIAVDDFHHKAADQPRSNCNKAAKIAKKAARQEAKQSLRKQNFNW